MALKRDRLTWLIYGSLGVYGFFIYTFGPTVPLLRDDQGTSRAVSGLHSSALALGAITSGLTFAWLAARWGRGRVLACALLGLAAGIGLYISGTSLEVTLGGAVVCGIFGATVVNATTPILSDHHEESGPAAITEGNAVATAVGAIAPVVLGAVVAVGLGWRAGLVLAMLGIVGVLVFGVGVGVPDQPAGAEGSRVRRPVPRAYWWSWSVIVLAIAVEFCVLIWASDLLRQELDAGPAAAAGSLTLVIVGMTVGRLAVAQLLGRRTLEGLLLAGLGLSALGFAVLWTAPALSFAWVGLLVLGVGLGTLFPLAISRSIAATNGQPDVAAARASVGAGIAVGSAPFALGWLADSFGVHTAFLLVPILLAAAALILLSGAGQHGAVAPLATRG